MSAGLRACTRRLDDDLDLLAFAGAEGVVWQRDGVGLAGRGEAARIDVSGVGGNDPGDAVAARLATIEIDDAVGLPGTGPVAVGALDFEPGRGGSFVVPEQIVGRTADGTRWLTTIRPPDSGPPADEPKPEPTGALHDAARYEVRSSRPAADWCRSVAAARDQLRAGRAAKVVLAREVVVRADVPFRIDELLRRLRGRYPSCMLFGVEGFVGASPELLVARHGDIVRSHPLAGTAPRSADPTTDARLAATLLASAKDLEEHQITIDMVHETLLPWCSYLDAEAEPSIVAVANVQHLGTVVEGRLSDPPPSVLDLVTALHPTPAVGGTPRDVALEMIAEWREQLIDKIEGAINKRRSFKTISTRYVSAVLK